ncbi:AlpA family phage regulatory protein [Vibrio cholerae]
MRLINLKAVIYLIELKCSSIYKFREEGDFP